MRELHIVSHNGTILAPLPPPVQEEKQRNRDEDPLMARRRAHYEQQLGRPVSDAELKNYP